MTIPAGLFRVATEFRFEVGAALLGVNRLRNATEELSQSASGALDQFKALGFGIAGSFGLGAGGVIGTLGRATMASESLAQSQTNLANIIEQNMHMMTGTVDTFNDRLRVSDEILRRISRVAIEFGVNEAAMVSQVQSMAAILAPKGLAGRNFETAIDMARGLMKSAPILGVEPFNVQGQLMRMLEGRAGMESTLFIRLASETQAFLELGEDLTEIASELNKMDVGRRVETMRRALTQFGDSAEINERILLSLSGQMSRINSLLFGADGAFRRLGDTIREAMIPIFVQIGDFIEKEGKQIADALARFIQPILENPRELIVGLMQLSRLGMDIRRTGFVSMIAAIVVILRRFPAVGAGIAGAMSALGSFLVFLVPSLGKLASLSGVLRFVMAGLAFAATKLLPPMLAIFSAFTLFSRAISEARLRSLEGMTKALPQFLEQMNRLRESIAILIFPITEGISAIVNLLAELLRFDRVVRLSVGPLRALADFTERMAAGMIGVEATMRGFFTAIAEGINQLLSMFSDITLHRILTGAVTDAFDSQALKDAFFTGMLDVFRDRADFLARFADGDLMDRAVVEQEVNFNGPVNINNQFREQVDPDRIAFTVQEQLLDLARNPTQGRRRSFAGDGF